MRSGIITRLTLAVAVVAAVLATAIRAGAADPSTKPAAGATASAQTSTQASSKPAATRYVAVIPPGFHVVSANGREAICVAADDAWVKLALTHAGAATHPSTMPMDILRRLDLRHVDLAQDITTDLGLTDTADATDFLENTLRPAIEKIERLRPRVLYLVASSEQIVTLIKNGWNEPHYHYDRFTGQPGVDLQMKLDPNGESDDIIMPVALDATTIKTPEQKQTSMEGDIKSTEGALEKAVAEQTPGMIYGAFQAYVSVHGIQPLHLTLGQQWFNLGVCDVLACKYLGDLWGVPREELVESRIRPLQNARIPQDRVDALHPINPMDIRPEDLPAYVDALRRKGGAAIDKLVVNHHEDAIGLTIAKLRETVPARQAATRASTQPAATEPAMAQANPSTRSSTRMATTRADIAAIPEPAPVVAPPAAAVADGEALVALIKSISGVDLTDTLSR